MDIKTVGMAGTMESSDIMVTIEPSQEPGIVIDLNSTVERRFGREIRRVINETLTEFGIDRAKVKAVDKGALDCAIRARVKTAAHRACDVDTYVWETITR